MAPWRAAHLERSADTKAGLGEMKLGNCALLLTMTAITACDTGTPVAPSQEESFVLLINPSPSCRTVQSPIPLDAFELLVAGDLVGRGASTLRAAPPADQRCNPSDLVLEFTGGGSTVTGLITGSECFVTGGVWTAGFTRPGVQPGRLQGTLQQLANNGLAVMNGNLDGTINIGLKFSAFGGECTAPDHRWSLQPREGKVAAGP